MGNAVGKLTPSCLCPANNVGDISQRHDIAVVLRNPIHDDGLGHSFCYIPPENQQQLVDNKVISSTITTTNSSSSIYCSSQNTTPFFGSISGASISANTSTPLSTALLLDDYTSTTMDRASSFESSSSFASVPLQPIPRNLINSGPLPLGRNSGSCSGLIERGFLSGPIERGVLSGPIDQQKINPKLERIKSKYEFNKWGSIKGIKDSIMGVILGNGNHKTGYDSIKESDCYNESVGKSSTSIVNFSCQMSVEDDHDSEIGHGNGSMVMEVQNSNLQWAQGKAGEDRVHVVISEDHGWVFVGIYDGFNGPDAPDYLLSNLYSAVDKELKCLLHHCRLESESNSASNQSTISKDSMNQFDEEVNDCCRRWSGLDCSSSNWCVDQEEEAVNDDASIKKRQQRNRNSRQILEIDDNLREKINQMGMSCTCKMKHSDVLRVLSDALRKTEEAYLEVADKMVKENPELFLMGSCVLAMLMIGEDIYLMNVGDSRAVLGQKPASEAELLDDFPHISSLQLTADHNTYVKEEVQRIRKEHPDDPFAVANDRVKGSLKVTRAFGAGFLKQDRFLILSSDGLYQYFTNEEAVCEVEIFMTSTPEGDPAQHLIEEVLFRAAKKAGLDFYDLLEIPQGERRRYHDDVSLIVISLERKIWRSSL
ncbi:putative protein phosphatase 2C 4 [Bienertia sinuspersici]